MRRPRRRRTIRRARRRTAPKAQRRGTHGQRPAGTGAAPEMRMHDADVPSRHDPGPFADGVPVPAPAPAPVAAPAPVPVLPLALDYADPATGRRHRRWLRAGRYAAAFAWLLCAAAWVLLRFVDVETVLV